MKNRKILYVGGPTGFVGGIERYAFQTAQALRHAGATLIWCGDAPTTTHGQAQFQAGFDAVLTLQQTLEQTDDFDLVALHKLPELKTLQALRKRFGERLVFWAHDHSLYCPRQYYYTPFGRTNCQRPFAPLRCFFCAMLSHPRNWQNQRSNHSAILRELRQHHLVVLSSYMAENLWKNGCSREKVHLLHPLIPGAENVAPKDIQDHLKIVFAGQLIRGKGADLMLETLHRLDIPWQASIVGDGKDRPMLEAMAKQLGISDRITFTGWLDHPEVILDQSDVALFPSRWQEPFGLAGAEAQAHGLPVVAFDVGGVREWLEHGITGYVVPPLDTNAIARCLEELFQHPEQIRRLGENGRRKMQEVFSPERFLEAFQQLLRQVTK